MRFLLRYTRIMKHRSLLPGAVWLVISGAFLSFAQNNPVELYAAEGQAALAAGRYRDADKAFEQVRELERAYTGLKRDKNAVEVAMELNRLYPDDPEILYQTAKIYGNFAFLTMWKLAQVAPNSVWRHLAAGECEESQGSYDQALQEYR